VNVYRVAPSPLPSMRDYSADAIALAGDLDPIERAFLPSRGQASIAREYPALAAALDDAVRADEFERRARRAPPPWRCLPDISLDAMIRGAELNFRDVGQGDRWERLIAPGKPVFA